MNINYNPELIVSLSSKISMNGTYFYNKLFSENSLNITYKSISIESLDLFNKTFDYLNIYGASIATPFKSEIINKIDSLTPIASLTNSVNCVKRSDNKLLGHNTDVLGLIKILEKYKDLILENDKVLIYGTGGVVSSLVYAIREVISNVKIHIYGRNIDKKEYLADQLGLINVDNTDEEYKLFINATPIDNEDNIFNFSKNSKIVFDLNPIHNEYNLENKMKSRNQIIIRGFEFYLYQMIEQYKFYTDMEVSLFRLLTLAKEKND